jgi:hypothetical protein
MGDLRCSLCIVDVRKNNVATSAALGSSGVVRFYRVTFLREMGGFGSRTGLVMGHDGLAVA